jgi:hypothetical protein
MRRTARAALVAAFVCVAALVTVPTASADAGGAAGLAAANLGHSAGTCADNPMTTSLGDPEYESSCDGNGGNAEYWCADFAKWAWENSGLDVSGLTAAAGSFATYGETYDTLHTSSSYIPQVGDAIVYGWDGNSYADHVGIVTSVNSDGSIATVNGDINGTGADETSFAQSSSVVEVDIPAGDVAPGNYIAGIGYSISAYVSPVSATSPPPTAKYWVDTFANAPVYASPTSTVQTGTLDAGTNYVYCKVWGPMVGDSTTYNHWWLKTDPDIGPADQYVSAYYLSKWGNDQALDNNGNPIADC